jgi:hypothetical protein
MSHLAVGEMVYESLPDIQKALEDMGYSLQEGNTKVQGWYKDQSWDADYVYQHENASTGSYSSKVPMQLGVKKTDKGWEFVRDQFEKFDYEEFTDKYIHTVLTRNSHAPINVDKAEKVHTYTQTQWEGGRKKSVTVEYNLKQKAISVQTSGYQGKECLNATKKVEKAFGITSWKPTSEYFNGELKDIHIPYCG